MNYIDAIFNRANTEQITSFLLYGCECTPDGRPFIEQAKAAQNEMVEALRERYPDTYESILDIAFHYTAVIEDVYTEIGLCIGFRLAESFASPRRG